MELHCRLDVRLTLLTLDAHVVVVGKQANDDGWRVSKT